jgi:hypothetical protein
MPPRAPAVTFALAHETLDALLVLDPLHHLLVARLGAEWVGRALLLQLVIEEAAGIGAAAPRPVP